MKFVKGAKIHFVGINGVSMSALAKLCAHNGAIVSGSDANANISEFGNENIFCHSGENPDIIDGVDIVVYSSAIKSDNAEIVRAKIYGQIAVLPST
ncbi:MAG: Mur ligase domain-containing protein, partial [Clostridia bacterium]|nr:Mur ligase domain-containing protein [Clostridia bacterium]